MSVPTLEIDGLRVPCFLYGTAWKEDETERLVKLALDCGFRGIDTANQRRHYHEAAVGRALAAAIAAGRLTRDELFVQTKYTFRRGQDHRLPYDPAAPIPTQVEQSLASSLEHLGVDVIDSYLLHGATHARGLTRDDWQAWRAMEVLFDSGRVRLLGVSNFSLDQLESLFGDARVPPRFVQNRCYANRGWDRRVREFCRAHNVVYQGFSLLTANVETLRHPEVARIAKRHGRTLAQIAFRFALDVGMLPLTGTTNPDHMRADLNIFDFKLTSDEVAAIEGLATA